MGKIRKIRVVVGLINEILLMILFLLGIVIGIETILQWFYPIMIR